MDHHVSKSVFTIVQGAAPGNVAYWVRIGTGTMHPDGSLALRLEAVPVNGEIYVRDDEPARPRLPAPGAGRPRFGARS